jgi:hypothetical protein
LYHSAKTLVVVNVANVACGFYGMRVVDVPLFLCFRRTAAAFVLVMEFLYFRKKPLPTIAFAVALTCVGALIAGVPVMQSQGPGLLWLMGNNVFTALSLTMVRRLLVRLGGMRVGGAVACLYGSCALCTGIGYVDGA